MNGIIAIREFFLIILLTACVSSKPTFENLPFANFAEEVRNSHKFGDFSSRGPFKVYEQRDYTFSGVNLDLFQAVGVTKHPTVIIMHGNAYSKYRHSYQAWHLASWGWRVLVPGLPNQRQWLENAEVLKRLAFNLKDVILVGHSFGGSAVVLAAVDVPDLKGVVLLDPAVYHEQVRSALGSLVDVPVCILGADPRVFRAKGRGNFFRWHRGPSFEVSLLATGHEDAQWPALQFLTRGKLRRQQLFLNALLVSLFSLVADGGSLSYAGQTLRSRHRDLFGWRLKAGVR